MKRRITILTGSFVLINVLLLVLVAPSEALAVYDENLVEQTDCLSERSFVIGVVGVDWIYVRGWTAIRGFVPILVLRIGGLTGPRILTPKYGYVKISADQIYPGRIVSWNTRLGFICGFVSLPSCGGEQ